MRPARPLPYLIAIAALALLAACGGGGSGAGDATEVSGGGPEQENASLPGTFVDLPELYGGTYPDTAQHVREDVDYLADGNTLPPVGGPHWGSGACPPDPAQAPEFCGPAQWGVYREAWDEESLVHNMEHGGVLIWYHTSDQGIIDELELLAVERLRDGQFVILSPYPAMEEEAIALTAWSYIDAFPASEYSRDRVETFVDAHDRRFTPEGILE